MGQSGSGDAQGGCGVDSAWGEALARATPTTSVTHIAFQEEQNGVNVTWMEKVTDEQYKLGK
jgi:hypothetical protein